MRPGSSQSRTMMLARAVAATAALAVLTAAIRWRRNPSACPYNQRFWVEAPHPLITRSRLLGILAPAAGERLLEIGPGTGYYSLEVAERVSTLQLFDLQQKMLDHVARRARARGLSNLGYELGDARSLGFADGQFDGAYLVTVLGEIADQEAALRELWRVIRPGGRLVCGELFGDPHMVTSGVLRRRCDAVGFSFERQVGGRLGYFARFGR